MKSFFDEAVLALDLSMEQTTLPRIVFYFNEGIFVEGHKGVMDYKDDLIVLRIGKEKLFISGEKLRVKKITADQIFIRGKILSVGTVKNE